MKIDKVERSVSFNVTLSDGEYPSELVRYSGTNWAEYYGDSLELIYDSARIVELEEAFSQYFKKKITGLFV